MTPTRRKYFLFSVFMIISLVLDQWTKVMARAAPAPARALQPEGDRQRLLRSPLCGEPRGGVQHVAGPAGRAHLADAVGDRGVRCWCWYYLRKTPVENSRLHIALGLVGGGAIGNLIDRMLFGKVTDFIVWKVGVHEWPAFNIADAALCVGVGLMVLDMFLTRREVPSSA